MADTEHLALVSVIRNLHNKLRQQYHACENDVDKIWDEHCQNEVELLQYASAMHRLAQQYWKQNNATTRIDWCYNVIRDYFLKGGYQKHLTKDWKCLKNNVSMSDYVNSQNPSMLDATGMILLLDVGSCYNPFKEYDNIRTVALDMCPATPDVYKCDFLKLQVEAREAEVNLTDELKSLSSPITSLPEKTFHVVVFSLFLEYLPSANQRFLCCKKANEFLVENGILLIITPDSKHQNYNAKMMKSWKSCLETLGLKRIKYEKQPHLHCLAFRKLPRKLIPEMTDSVSPITTLCIPQDRRDHSKIVHLNSTKSPMKAENDYESLRNGFLELPQSICLDDD